MHKRGIVHRDLKLENTLVKAINGKFIDIRVIDFGTAFDFKVQKEGSIERLVPYLENQAFIDFTGTLVYMAPEVLR